MKRRILLLCVMMTVLGSLSMKAQEAKKSLIGDYLSISGWMNIQYDYEQQLNNEDVLITDINTFNVRRARLDIKGNINKNLEFRVQGDFAGSPKLVDGFVKVKLNKYFNIQAGQFKIPFTFENPQSPLTLEGIEYAQVISKLSGYSDISGVKTYSGGRDVGVMIYGNLFSFENNGKEIPVITYKLGLFNGNGMNNKDANTLKDIAASIEVCPLVKGLMLAASYYDGNYMLSSLNEKDAVRDRLTFGGKYENGRLTVRSEFITGKTDIAKGEAMYNLNSDGFYVAGGYWFNVKSQKIRPVARYDFFRQDITDATQNSTYYMVGIDWWPYNNLRLLLNYTIKDKANYENFGHLLQAQLSVKF